MDGQYAGNIATVSERTRRAYGDIFPEKQAWAKQVQACGNQINASQDIEYGLKSAVENLRDVTADVCSEASNLRIALGLYDKSTGDGCSAPSAPTLPATEMVRIAATRLREALFDLRRVQSHINS